MHVASAKTVDDGQQTTNLKGMPKQIIVSSLQKIYIKWLAPNILKVKLFKSRSLNVLYQIIYYLV